MTARKIDSSSLRAFATEGRTTKDMSEHFACTTETVRRWLRKERLLDDWIARRCRQNTCEHCGQPAADQFCSKECWGYAQRRVITVAMLAPYVKSGIPLIRMSAELKINRRLLRAALIRNGQFKDWTQRRYKKCAFQKAGSMSVSTASGVATTQSSRSEAPAAGVTNYGA